MQKNVSKRVTLVKTYCKLGIASKNAKDYVVIEKHKCCLNNDL